MAKPSSGGKRGGWVSVNSAVGSDGIVINLAATPLKYGGSTDMTDAARNTVEGFEDTHFMRKTEYGLCVSKDGVILNQAHGGKGSVKTPRWAYNKADVFTHNHPRSDGVLGGTLSGQDVQNFAYSSLRVARATAAEGTYSISKLKNFDDLGLVHYYDSAVKQAHATMDAAVKPSEKAYQAVVKDYKAGKVTYSQVDAAYKAYEKVFTPAANAMLVEMHNALIAGQKQYGYSYALERRKNG